MRSFQRFTMNLGGVAFRREELEGRMHLVVPTVMLTEGVHTGSEGPVLYLNEENAKDPGRWNNMPAVVYHPEENGKFISARQPVVLNTRGVGRLLNTTNDDKLKTEAWLDEERLKGIDNRIFQALEKGQKVEVSTGLSVDLEMKDGEWNGVKYKAIARNYQPDHLAILPDKVGACSIAKGAGLLANGGLEPESTQEALGRAITVALGNIGATVVANEMSFTQVSRSLSDLLAAKYGQKGKYWDGWVVDVFSNTVVFCNGDGSGQLLMVGYTAADSGIQLSGEAKQVVRVVEYKTPDGKAYVGNTQPGLAWPNCRLLTEKEPENMARKDQVDALIANKDTGWEEGDRSTLMAYSEEKFAKLTKAATPAPPPPPVAPPIVNAATTPAPQSIDEWKKNQPPEIVAVFNQGQAALAAEKEKLVATIMNSAGCLHTKEQLMTVNDLNILRAMASLAAAGPKITAPNPADVQNFAGTMPGFFGYPMPGVGAHGQPQQMGVNNFAGAAGAVPNTGLQNAGQEEPLGMPAMFPAPAKQA